jgi:hypothetical protein
VEEHFLTSGSKVSVDLGWFGVLSNKRTLNTKLLRNTNAFTARTTYFKISLGIGY